MSLPSSQLQWLLVKKHNAFQIKKDGITFSCEPNNSTNLDSYKYSGLCNSKAVGVSIVEKKDKKGLVLSVQTKKASKPSKSSAKYALNRNLKRNVSAIEKATSGSYYRSDLSKAAVARYLKLKASLASKADLKTIIQGLKDAKKE
eukprot:CAMPEP_0197515244 /NCGR_PEP_ID=MMETSP1318-20131121/435_1 /TAXON_ID=552666 /ORGANISM="Partenskyella glossopodia, Strain RCC365" /LENGTH=144 /DNA_ID=CAMNT_0043063557 /DNA_START=34 /DNA_END=468 /DNA_ORIENTATION=-